MPDPIIRILVVEDEVAVRQYLLRALDQSIPQVELVAAEDGLRALDLLRTMRVDLILSDQQMPLLTGMELLQLVRAESAIPFILISADHSIETSALRAGATAFLSKPMTLTDLRAAVRSALQSSASGKAEPRGGEGSNSLEHQPSKLPQFC